MRYLSVDGGGTKTAFLLTDGVGNCIAKMILGPTNYIVNGLDTVIHVLRDGITECLKDDDNSQEIIDGCFIAVAGYGDIPKESELVKTGIINSLSEFKIKNIMVGNDTENAIAGSLLGKPGIHVISGTGSIGLGIDVIGTQIRSGGWHHLFGGDEGSGYWIGCKLLQHFTKQADGRKPKTVLYSAVMQRLDLECPENMIDVVINQWNGDRDKIGSLSHLVFDIAESGDQEAKEIFKEAADELALIVKAIYSRGVFDKPLFISYSGGVFKSGKYIMHPFLETLKDISCSVSEPVLGPLAGGIVLAMKTANHDLTDEAVDNLKRIDIE